VYRQDVSRLSDVNEDCSAVSFSRNVFNLMNEIHCAEKLVAQTYDDAAVMAELQK
jgi:hypothetical protein